MIGKLSSVCQNSWRLQTLYISNNFLSILKISNEIKIDRFNGDAKSVSIKKVMLNLEFPVGMVTEKKNCYRFTSAKCNVGRRLNNYEVRPKRNSETENR